MRVDLVLDHKIRTPWNLLPEELKSGLLEALTVPNQAKVQALKQSRWEARDMPDNIPMFRFDHGEFCMPRGFLSDLQRGLRDLGHTWRIDDRRSFEPLYRIGEIITLRDWQAKALPVLLEAEHGIWKAPAGSGKTVGILAMIRKLACKSLVIVNTKDILWQWQERAFQFLGPHYPVGQIGDNVFDVSGYLTIATAQTLVSRFDQLEADGFFEEFGAVYLDECHWATAETYQKLMNRFAARIRQGVSATPDKTGDFELAKLVLGPIAHVTKPAEVATLMKPKLIRIPTKFGFGYKAPTSRWTRSNYPEMLDALIDDRARNQLIAAVVNRYGVGHHCLLFTARVRHLEILRSYIEEMGYSDPILTLTGRNSNEERKAAKAFVEREPSLLLSTVANEALDIPRLDRGFLVYPQGNVGLVTQQIGRFERVHPDKKDAMIFDIADLNVGPCERQWRKRRTEVYMPRGYAIETMKVEDVLEQAA